MATTLGAARPRPSVRALAAAAITALCFGGVLVASMDTAHPIPALVPNATAAPALPAASFVPAPTIAPESTMAPQVTPAGAPRRAQPEATAPATGTAGPVTSPALPPQAAPQGGTGGPVVVDPADLYRGTDDGAPGALPSKSTVKH